MVLSIPKLMAISPLEVLALHWPERWPSPSCSSFSTLRFRVDLVNPTYWSRLNSIIKMYAPIKKISSWKTVMKIAWLIAPVASSICREVARGLLALSILSLFYSLFLLLSTTFLFFSELFGICCCNQSAIPCWRLLLHWFFKIFHQRLKHYIVLQSASRSYS